MIICLVDNIVAVSTLKTSARCKLDARRDILLWKAAHTDSNIDVAMMLMPGSFYSPALVVLSWVAGTLSQPSIKRASAIAMINAVCNTPNGMSGVLPCRLLLPLMYYVQYGRPISIILSHDTLLPFWSTWLLPGWLSSWQLWRVSTCSARTLNSIVVWKWGGMVQLPLRLLPDSAM